MTTEEKPAAPLFRDEDLVYVDPDNRSVIGPIEWSRSGNPKSLPVPEKPKDEKEGRRRAGRKYYPFGTYRSMKHAFNLEGKQKKFTEGITVDESIARSQKNFL